MGYQIDFEYDNLALDLEFGNTEYFITAKSSLKQDTFAGMKQPVPPNAIIGYEIILNMMHEGDPLANKEFVAKWDESDLTFKTDEMGDCKIQPPFGSKVNIKLT